MNFRRPAVRRTSPAAAARPSVVRPSVIRPLTIFAVLSLSLSGLLVASPAVAQSDSVLPEAVQSEAEQAEAVQLAETPEVPAALEAPTAPPTDTEERVFADAGLDLVGVGVSASGETVVVTTGGDIETSEGQQALEEFANARGEEVTTLELAGPVEAVASGELVGGSGIVVANPSSNRARYCTIGFAAWSPEREPAFLTAGHCKYDSGQNLISAGIPADAPAAGGAGTDPNAVLTPVGKFGFSQYGGPGNSPGAQGDLDSIDLAVIDVDTTEGWILKPAVTDWSTPGRDPGSLADSAIEIEQVAAPQIGPISRSGRTSGLVTGEVRPVDVVDGWVRVSGRWVYGFSSAVQSRPGDSGGPVIQGSSAVGIVSGTGTGLDGIPFTWSTLLTQALPATGGYEVALDIAAPVVSAHEVLLGDAVEVAMPGNATGLTITVNGEERTIAPVNGVAAIPAPMAGHYEYTLTATNGMSQSAPASAAVTVKPPAPGITSVSGDMSFDADKGPRSISGTGIDGATVEIAVNVVAVMVIDDSADNANSANSDSSIPTFTTTVRDGAWSVDIGDAAFNGASVELSATQAINTVASAATELSFHVSPTEPVRPRTETPPATPTKPVVATLAKTGAPNVAWTTGGGSLAAGTLLLGAMLLGAAAIRRRQQPAGN